MQERRQLARHISPQRVTVTIRGWKGSEIDSCVFGTCASIEARTADWRAFSEVKSAAFAALAHQEGQKRLFGRRSAKRQCKIDVSLLCLNLGLGDVVKNAPSPSRTGSACVP